jgi:hypothetical protein
VKIKLYNILYLLNKDGTDVLSKMAKTSFDDGVTIFRVMKNIQNIAAELKSFEAIRQGVVEKLGVENKETQKIEILPNTPQMEEYLKQMNAMAQDEIDINIFMLNPEYLKGFTPVELMQIDWMLIQEEVK